jgi:hypothetical protein
MSAAVTLEAGAIGARIKTTIGELLQTADQLRDLSSLIDAHADLGPNSDAEQLKQAGTGVRSAAMSVLLTAAATIALGERFAILAYVRSAEVNDDE